MDKEQTKAKTTEEISFPAYACKILSEIGWKGFDIEQIKDFANKSANYQSHIANLEAEKADLERLSQSDQKHIASIEKQNSQYIKLIDRFVKSPKNGMLGNIRNLEAQNKELRGLIKELLGMAKDGYRLHVKNCSHQEFLEEDLDKLSRAEQALKEDKNDG